MKSLLPILKTKLFLLGFVSACTVILASTVPQIRNFITSEKVIGEKITTEQQKAASKIKKQNKTINVSRATSSLSLDMENTSGATVTSDKPDYAPLSTAVFTGDGFGANEDVVLKVKNLTQPCNTVSADSSYFPWTVRTDGNGHFETNWTVCNCPGDSLRLRAVGQTSHDTAYAYFTDAPQPDYYASLVITSLSSNGPFCPRSQFRVYYEDLDLTHSYQIGNVFTVQLSNPGGGFNANPDEIGSALASTQVIAGASGFIDVTIPSLNGVGSNRKLRIISSIPAAEGFVRPTDIFINPGPEIFDVTGDVSFCPGGSGIVHLDGSVSGVNYELYRNGTTTGVIVAGTGNDIDFPPQSAFGTYTVIGKNTTSPFCTNEMDGDAVFSSSPAPVAQTLTPTPAEGTVCSGVDVYATTSGGSGGTGTVTDVLLKSTDGGSSWTSYTSGVPISTTGLSSVSIKTYRTSTGSGCPTSTENIVSWTVDGTPPEITICPGTQTVTLNANCEGTLGNYISLATASDGCSIPTITQSPVAGTAANGTGSLTVTLTARDASNNTSTCSFTVNKVDVTAPYISCPGNQDINLNASCQATVPSYIGMATATDGCGTPTVTQSPAVGSPANGTGNFVVTLTATDGAGLTSTCSFTVTKTDITAPYISCPGNQNINLNASCQATVPSYIGMATATDGCGTPTVTQSPAVGSPANGTGNFVVTLTATDGAGLTSTCSFTVTKTDITAPYISCPGNQNINLNASCQATVPSYIGMATATDACGTPTVTQSPAVGSPANGAGNFVVTLTATDGAGLTSTCSFTVTKTDITAPYISCPGNQNIDLNASCQATVPSYIGMATATDACGTPTVTQSPAVGSPANGTGNFVVTLTATDGAGLTSTCSFTVTKTDITAPYISCPGNQNINLNASCQATVPSYIGMATATDACGTPTVTQSPAVGSPANGTGNFVVTLTATDGAGLTSTCSFTVTKTDITAPYISCPGNQNINLNASCQATVPSYIGMATATDACGTPTVTQSPAVGSPANGTGNFVVTLTATDGAGLTSTCSFTVTKTDITAPYISCLGNQNINLNASCQATVPSYIGMATATDACGTPTVTQSPAVGSPANGTGNFVVTLTATDGAGLTSTCSFTVTKTDITAPYISCPGNQNINLNASCQATVPSYIGMATATDACGTPTVTQSPAVGSPANGTGNFVVTLTATDGAGLTSTCSFTVTKTDITAPYISCPGNQNINLNASCQATVPSYIGMATATDACGTPTVTQSPAVGSPANGTGNFVVTLTATDGAGLTSTCSFTVTKTDITAPYISCPGNQNINLNASCQATVPSYIGMATATDACGTPTVTQSPAVGSPANGTGNFVVTLTATDGAGLTSTCSFTVTKTDITAPYISCPGNQNINLNASCQATVPSYIGMATATDACGTPTVTQSPAVGSPANGTGNFVVTLTATDGAGLTSTCSFTVTKTDITAPYISCPGNQNINLNASCQATVPSYIGMATATDACGTPTVTQSPAVGSPANGTGNFVVTLTATDGAGLTSTCSFTVTKTDITAPYISCPGNQNINLNASCQATVPSYIGMATATDACGTPTVTQSPAVGSPANGTGNFVVTLTATDGAGLTSTCSFTVTKTDITAPTITAPTTVDLECAGALPAAASTFAAFDALAGATGSDNCTAAANLTVTSITSALDGTSCNGTITRTYTISDASNNSITVHHVFTVTDNTVPTAICKNITIALGTDGTADITASDVNNGSGDNCDASVGLTIDKSHFTDAEVGTASCSRNFAVKLTVTDDCGNTTTCSSTVTVGKRTTKLVYSGDASGQYSDVVNVKATLTDITGNPTGPGIAGKTIKFTIGSQNITAVTDANGLASASITLNQNPATAVTVASCFVADGIYCGSTDSDGFDITPEDACGSYNGTLFANSNSPTGGTATVRFKVVVTELADGSLGDVRNATVKFNVRDAYTNAEVTGSPFTATLDASASTATQAVFYYDYTVNLSTSQLCKTFDVSWTVGGYYTNTNTGSCSEQSTQVTVAAPADDFSAGGGYIVLTNNAYGPNIGVAGSATGKNNWGYNVKWNKSLTNLQGNFNTIIRKNGRTYQVKSNKPTFLKITLVAAATSTTPAKRRAEITYGNATLKDVTDIVNGVCTAPGGVCWGDGNGIIYLTVEDNGEPGSTGSILDKIGFAVKDKNNSLWYSTNTWANTTSTITLQTIDGGNIQIRQASSGGTVSNQTVSTDITTDITPTVLPFDVKAFPNPSEHVFSLVLENATNEKVQIVVYDALGRQVKMFEKQSGNIPIHFGMDLKVGVYVVEVRQGDNRKTLKLVKQ